LYQNQSEEQTRNQTLHACGLYKKTLIRIKMLVASKQQQCSY